MDVEYKCFGTVYDPKKFVNLSSRVSEKIGETMFPENPHRIPCYQSIPSYIFGNAAYPLGSSSLISNMQSYMQILVDKLRTLLVLFCFIYWKNNTCLFCKSFHLGSCKFILAHTSTIKAVFINSIVKS